MESKGKDSTALPGEEWKCKLAFLTDVAAHLNFINLQLHGRHRMITDMCDAVKAFLSEAALMGDECASVPVVSHSHLPNNIKFRSI